MVLGATDVPLMTSLKPAPGVGFCLLPTITVDDHLDRHADQVVVDLHVVVGRDGVVLVERPVEAAGAGVAVDGRVLRHHIVATFSVVVVLADLTDEDVVAWCDLGRIVEERRRVVTDQQVLAGATLDPVVATVAEHGVGALAGDDEVVAGTGERLVVVGSTVDEVLTIAAHEDVVTDTSVEGVVAGATLFDIGATEVGDDVVAFATEGDVVAAVAFDDVVAEATPEGVVVVAAEDPVDAVGAVVHGLAVDPDRIDAVDLAVLDGAVRLAQQQAGSRRSRSSTGHR